MEWRWETQKKSEKRELVKDKWYNKMGQVGTSWSRGTRGTRRGRSSDLSGTSGTRRRGSWDLGGTSRTRTRGLPTWTIPLVPNGTTRPCTFVLRWGWVFFKSRLQNNVRRFGRGLAGLFSQQILLNLIKWCSNQHAEIIMNETNMRCFESVFTNRITSSWHQKSKISKRIVLIYNTLRI